MIKLNQPRGGSTGRTQTVWRHGRRLVMIAVWCAVPLPAANAADWQLGASLTEEFVFDDNISLQTGSPKSVWGLSTRPQISLDGRSPRFDLGVNGGLNYSFFDGRNDLDSFDQSAGLNGTYRGQRSVLGLIGRFQRATTRTTEVNDTGQVLTDAVRLSFSAGPSWSYVVSPVDRLGLRANVSHVTFDTNALNDYNNYSGGPFWSRQLTEKDTVEFSGTYSRFDRRSGLNLISDSVGGSVKLSHKFSPRLDSFVSAGGHYVRTREDVVSGPATVTRTDEGAGVSAAAGATLKSERASVTGAFARSLTPSGSGRLQQRNSLTFSGRYNWTPLITASVSANYTFQNAIDNGVDTKREFIGAEPAITWNVHRNWGLRMAYRFRTQTLGDGGERVYSNAGLASVTWRLPTLPRGGTK